MTLYRNGSEALVDVVRNLSDLADYDNPVTLKLPGSTVTFIDLMELLDRSYTLAEDPLAFLFYKELSEILDADVWGQSVSERLSCIETSELLVRLGQLNDALSAVKFNAPNKQSELTAFREELNNLIRDWETLLDSDFSDEQRVCVITVAVAGPTSRIVGLESELRSAIDTVMLMAVKDLPVGIAGNGRPFILDLEGPEHLDTFIYGEAVRQRYKELGVPLVSQSLVDAFFSDLAEEWSTTEDEEPEEQ